MQNSARPRPIQEERGTPIRPSSRRLAPLFAVALSAALTVVALPVGPAALAAGCGTTHAWNVASGSWTDGGNWSPAGPPGAGDCATISNGGTATLDGDTTVKTLTLSNGALAGTGALHLTDTLAWSGGFLTGTGTTQLDAGADGSITGIARLCDGRTLGIANGATATIEAGGTLAARGGTLVEAAGNLRVDRDGDGVVFTDTGASEPNCSLTAGDAAIHVTGSLRKTDGAGEAALYADVENDGAVRSDSGTLSLLFGGGDGEATGSFGDDGDAGQVTLGGGATFPLGDGAEFAGGVSIGGGPGNAAIVDVAGGATATATGENTLLMSTVGGPGELVIEGTFDWTSTADGAATMIGAGTTTVAPGGTLAIGGRGVNLSATRTIENEGTVEISGEGYIAADGDTVFRNAATGTFRLLNDGGYYQGVGVIPPGQSSSRHGRAGSGDGHLNAFVNDGLLVKADGDGTSIVDAYFSGDGDVQVDSGNLEIWGSYARGTVAEDESLTVGGTTSDSVLAPDGLTWDSAPRDFGAVATNTDNGAVTASLQQVIEPVAPAGGLSFLPVTLVADGSHSAGSDAALAVSVDGSQLGHLSNVVAVNRGVIVPECGPVPPTAAGCVDRTDLAGGDVTHRVRTGDLGAAGGCCSIHLAEVRAKFVRVAGNGSFSPAVATQRLGGEVAWRLTGQHAIADASGLRQFSFAKRTGGTVHAAFNAAGTFEVTDKVRHTVAKIAVPVQSSKGTGTTHTTFVLTWALRLPSGCATCAFEVQSRFRRAGSQVWGAWGDLRNQPTLAFQGPFTPNHGAGSYGVRARVVDLASNAVSGYSPATVLTAH